MLTFLSCSTPSQLVSEDNGISHSATVAETDSAFGPDTDFGAADTNSLLDRAPSSPPPPPWVLSGLGEEVYSIRKPPSVACIQKYINEVAADHKKTPPSQNLAKWISTAAQLARIDTAIFTALIRQETGNFTSTDSGNGVGITQMTGNTIWDTCHALEGTGCEKPLANPEYLNDWEDHFEKGVLKLYGPGRNFRTYYPWRRAAKFNSSCKTYHFDKKTNCNRACGITASCMKGIRSIIHKDSRTAILLGTFTLANKLADARRRYPNAGLKTLYRMGLELYNGHFKYKKHYATKILDVYAPDIIKQCPSPIIEE